MALAFPSRQEEVTEDWKQHGAIGLDVNELHGIQIGEGKQEGADRRIGWRDCEMSYGEAPEAEETDEGHPGDDEHIGRERIDTSKAQRRVGDAEQKKCIRISEHATLRKEEERIGPIRLGRKHMAPMLDQREPQIAVLLIAECAVEGGKQPTAKYQRETYREQCCRNPTVRT